MERWNVASFVGTFGNRRPPGVQTIGVGDGVQIILWEASAGGLFSSPVVDRSSPGSRSAVIPEQFVGNDGAITVPYAGRIPVVGRTPRDVEQVIIQELKGKAIEPQALVTVTRNVANTVTVVGETNGARVPLTTRGDHILDVIADTGGTKAPDYEVFITLMRNNQSVRVPLEVILKDPKENIFALPGDWITVSREAQTYTAIGATLRNDVLTFAAVGISLEQAVGKAGGLDNQRADPGGVYVIRFESPENYDQFQLQRPSPGLAGDVPVVYRVDMNDPSAFFLARRFPIRNKDILFVSNAPASDFLKVGNVISTFLIPVGSLLAVGALTRQ